MFEIIFIVLLVLKLTSKPEMSWWTVFAPLLIELAVVIVFFLFFGLAALVGVNAASAIGA